MPVPTRPGPSKNFAWGLFGVPERELCALGDVANLDVIELGCGTVNVSAWLARLGARPVGVDLTAAQLDTARRCQEHFGLSFPLVEANAEDVPLPDGSFDLAVSEYGASVWCDPERWIPEAARLLRPGGRLVFLTNSVQVTVCVPEEGRTRRGPPAAATERDVQSAVAGWWDRVPSEPWRLDSYPPRQWFRGRSPPRAVRPRRREDPRLLRHCHSRVGQEMAG